MSISKIAKVYKKKLAQSQDDDRDTIPAPAPEGVINELPTNGPEKWLSDFEDEDEEAWLAPERNPENYQDLGPDFLSEPEKLQQWEKRREDLAEAGIQLNLKPDELEDVVNALFFELAKGDLNEKSSANLRELANKLRDLHQKAMYE